METAQKFSNLCPVIQSLLAASVVIFILSKLLNVTNRTGTKRRQNGRVPPLPRWQPPLLAVWRETKGKWHQLSPPRWHSPGDHTVQETKGKMTHQKKPSREGGSLQSRSSGR